MSSSVEPSVVPVLRSGRFNWTSRYRRSRLPGDDDVLLDLQDAFTAICDLPGYDLALGYTRPLAVPLIGEAAIRTEERLRAAGLRP